MAEHRVNGHVNHGANVLKPLRWVRDALVPPFLRGLKGQKTDAGKTDRGRNTSQDLEEHCSWTPDVGPSPPTSLGHSGSRERQLLKKRSSRSLGMGKVKRRLNQPLLARSYKITMLGRGGVGKSALTVQFVSHRFLGDYDPNIEDTYVKRFCVDQQPCRLEILDTAGESWDPFSAVRERYEITGDGFIVVYSITDKFSFDQAQKIIQQLRKRRRRSNHVSDGVIAMVGNKVDIQHQRQVSTENARKFAEANGCLFMEVAAADGHLGIDGLFTAVVRKIQELQQIISTGILPNVESLRKLDVSVRQVYSHEDLSKI